MVRARSRLKKLNLQNLKKKTRKKVAHKVIARKIKLKAMSVTIVKMKKPIKCLSMAHGNQQKRDPHKMSFTHSNRKSKKDPMLWERCKELGQYQVKTYLRMRRQKERNNESSKENAHNKTKNKSGSRASKTRLYTPQVYL